ncbi:MAG TPA: hypothetical protein VLT84_00535 [Acidobacteriota bacterium]|nr:hypothetical protein [Acidobacteriota bacterium]
MNAEEFDRIADDVLDGTASAADREALKAHLAEHPEARERYRTWTGLFEALKAVGLEESPSDLRPDVMRAIVAQHRRAGTSVSRPGWAEFLQGLVRAPSWRSALTFGSGVGVGAAAIALVAGNLVGGTRNDASDFSGAMMPRGARPTGTAVETATLRTETVSVTAGTRRTAEGVVLRIDASGDGVDGAAVLATFDAGALRPEALRMDPPSAGEVGLTGNTIRIDFTGAGSFTFSLRTEEARTAPLDLELHDGARISRTTLRTGSNEPTKQ